jgi:hypothetical protein
MFPKKWKSPATLPAFGRGKKDAKHHVGGVVDLPAVGMCGDISQESIQAGECVESGVGLLRG